MASPPPSNSGLPAAAIGELTSLYAQAAARWRQAVLHPPGGSAASRAARAARAAQLSLQIDQQLVALKAGTATWIGTNLPAAMAAGLALADRQAAAAGVRPAGSPLAGSFHLVDHGTAAVLARDIAVPLAAAAGRAGERAKRLLRQTAQTDLSEADVNRVLAGGAIAGSPAEATRALRDELRRVAGNTVTVIDRNGDPINFDAGYYADMVARTKIREASVVARHGRLSSLGLDVVTIVGRVSGNFCTAFLGKAYSLSGRSERYPAYSELPAGGCPFHPFCSKSTRPFVEELASGQQLDAADGLPDAEALHGATAAQAQRAYRDLQLLAQVKGSYRTTGGKLFGPGREGG